MSLRMERVSQNPRATLGHITVGHPGAPVLWTLEHTTVLIPAGRYPVRLRWSERFMMLVPGIYEVPDRTDIEIHPANKPEELLGCIAPGTRKISDVEIADSRRALGQLLTLWRAWESQLIEITESFA